MERNFKEDLYQTPEDQKIYLREKILLGNTKGFYWDFFRRTSRASRVARRNKFSYDRYNDVSMRILRDIEGHGGRFQIEGLNNFFNHEKPVVIAANHMSVLETQVMAGLLYPKKTGFAVKESLTRNIIFGPIMKAIYSIPLGRVNPIDDMKKVMEMGKEYLDQGVSIIIFPEGTRFTEFDPSRFNSMAVKLAVHAGVDVMPMAIKSDFWGQGNKMKDFGRITRDKSIHFACGKPLTPEGRGKAQHKMCVDFITEKLRNWGTPII